MVAGVSDDVLRADEAVLLGHVASFDDAGLEVAGLAAAPSSVGEVGLGEEAVEEKRGVGEKALVSHVPNEASSWGWGWGTG